MNLFRSYTIKAGFLLVFIASAAGGSAFGQNDQVAELTPETGVDAVSNTGSADASADTGTGSKPTEVSYDLPPLNRVGVQAADPLPLTLDEAIRKALQNNNTIEVTRDDVRFQEQQIRGILGVYDPVFTVNPTFSRNSTTGGSPTKDFTVNGDILQRIGPGGGNISAYFNNRRTENAFAQAQVTSGELGSSTSAVYSSSLGFRYTQPLLRNFSVDNTRH